MLNRIIKSLMTIGIASVVMTVGAYAAFSSQAVNRGNVLKAGTLILYADSDPDTTGVQTGSLFNLSDVKAGDTLTKQIFMKNGGTLGLSYNGQVLKTAGDDVLFSGLTLKIGTTSGGEDLYSGPMNGFTGFSTGGRWFSAGIGETLYFTVLLPGDAGESLQGKSLTVNFIFNATQSP
jgi:hypothetical protein